MADAEALFQALSDPKRRRVVELLGRGPLRASELAERVGLERNAMSRHLGVLRETGFVEVELSDEDARARVYRLRGERLAELRDWAERVEAQWRGQLDHFRRFTERPENRPPAKRTPRRKR